MKVHVIDYNFKNSVNLVETIEDDMALVYLRITETGIKGDISINGKKLSNKPVFLELLEIPNNQVVLAEIPKGSTLSITLYAPDSNQHVGQLALIGV